MGSQRADIDGASPKLKKVPNERMIQAKTLQREEEVAPSLDLLGHSAASKRLL